MNPDAALPNPLWSIWAHPRRTIRQLVDTSPGWHVVVLAGLGGIASALDSASTRHAGDEFALRAIIGMALIIGPLLGLCAVWIFAALLGVFGRWGGRSAPTQHLRLVLAWANVPAVVGLVLWIPLFGLVGREMFSESMPTAIANPVVSSALVGIGLVQVALAFWSLYIGCHGVAEVQGLRSAWVGLLHVLGALALVVVPFLLIAVAFRLLT